MTELTITLLLLISTRQYRVQFASFYSPVPIGNFHTFYTKSPTHALIQALTLLLKNSPKVILYSSVSRYPSSKRKVLAGCVTFGADLRMYIRTISVIGSTTLKNLEHLA